ncbi:MAG TPA: BON domain-containing protein [Rhodocyclaceae bacterium]|jgi:hyperosmotically inducible protein|nr:BON domain-containing protein [Rhodocyclaceae bacterium]
MNKPLSLLLNTVFASLLLITVSACDRPGDPRVPGQTSIGAEVDDSVITTKAKSALLNDMEFKGFDFKVDTHKGEVQLSGFVDNQSQIDRATALVKQVEGVKSVDNKVSIKSSTPSLGNRIDDGIITAQIKSAFLSDENIKSFDIGVVTLKGEVQLSGFVDGQGQIDRAIQVARSVPGVLNVKNEMSIKK